jgi:two-component system sensor histidine kinase QseC
VIQPRSLQGRLLALVLATVIVVGLATAAATGSDVRHELDELLDSHLAQAAAVLVVQQSSEIEADEHDDGVDAPSLHRYAPKVAFQVFHEGRLALRSANAPMVPMVDAGQRSRNGFATVIIDGAAWRVFTAVGGQSDVRVHVGEAMASRSAILWAVLRSMFWPIGIALPLLGLATWWAVSSGVAPLRRLGRALAEREPQALSPVVIVDAPSEMTPMLAALNALFGRIGELMDAERRFKADAAHELRTPIAAIRTQAQVALVETDDALRRHALSGLLAGCDRATRVVEQLLILSKLEAGAQAEAVAVDLSALLRRVVAELAPQGVHKHQTIAVDAEDSLRVQGDPTLLAILLRNLVDNAIRYSPPGASVTATLVERGAALALRIDDSGPGMSDADLQRIGERFFRVIGSGQSGSGLGWSIVQRIAAVHDAALQVSRSSTLGGLAVEVVWPAPLPH